ncbi:hypothetical protein PF010_g359 [Phytophthora fragariae]|uniref:Uncharacterized protein n=1 Tax=Phytophthora fragariae TaxID=53985 RepID=A0A6A3TMP0_9STRA|nr:hypothetical protein PF009_g370 [Phytophthora fragariae]KAE9139455.1 hypothetical protein PF007_g1030 [Phytophthora fragariae]KAE9140023.1 hypothetical protein PF010_g359 [Phytophthora fragariae]KAE9315567.1 hypothetical protein PF001_g7732 [Phytophthora fragariae]KAE9361302.1 hypothetical protein PF008_g1150 [Phytophthora fragariae]
MRRTTRRRRWASYKVKLTRHRRPRVERVPNGDTNDVAGLDEVDKNGRPKGDTNDVAGVEEVEKNGRRHCRRYDHAVAFLGYLNDPPTLLFEGFKDRFMRMLCAPPIPSPSRCAAGKATC